MNPQREPKKGQGCKTALPEWVTISECYDSVLFAACRAMAFANLRRRRSLGFS